MPVVVPQQGICPYCGNRIWFRFETSPNRAHVFHEWPKEPSGCQPFRDRTSNEDYLLDAGEAEHIPYAWPPEPQGGGGSPAG